MAGIYLHIPFCKQACHYCNFHFSTSLRYKDAMLNAIKQELELRKEYLNGAKVETVYFGGGTPSLLSAQEILSIFDLIQLHYPLAKDLEVTLEANPDDLTKEYLAELKTTPVNRLSIGLQSFVEEDLKFMNRAHNAQEAKQCLVNAQEAGFHNITIDLIYGTPTLSHKSWLKNLQTIFDLGIPHISCYALTVEPKTALAHFVKTGKVQDVEEEDTAQQFELLLEQMAENGYEQYEISNFCKPSFYAKHNSSYWKSAHYVGIGPSAHSFNGHSRQWNIANNGLYLKALKNNELNFELEELSETEQHNEYIMTSLRTKWGANVEHIANRWGVKVALQFKKNVEQYCQNGFMELKEEEYVLTTKGKLIADNIMSELFL
ncbi:MAG: radical SAM family heme chaperone HemW [Aureispira sp.]|nr:radical SAM family heme chaperone HemW [Aureispira sp.]